MSKSEGNVFSPHLFFPPRDSGPVLKQRGRRKRGRRSVSSHEQRRTHTQQQQQAGGCSEGSTETREDGPTAPDTLDPKAPQLECVGPQLSLTFFGADVLRLFVAAANYSRDILLPVVVGSQSTAAGGTPEEKSSDCFSPRGATGPDAMNALDQAAASYGKIRNTIKFLLGNLHDFDPGEVSWGNGADWTAQPAIDAAPDSEATTTRCCRDGFSSDR